MALTWIMAIFAVSFIVLAPFHDIINGEPGILHPAMLVSLTAISYLQSIYPLSIPMPAYLQWGRMWKYALPAIVLYSLYLIVWLCGAKPVRLNAFSEIPQHLIDLDLWLRMLSFLLSVYYVVNILWLPRRLLRAAHVPRYLKVFCFALGLCLLLFLAASLWYSVALIMTYMVCCTLLNMYLCYRTLETMAKSLPKPVIEVVEEEPAPELIAKAEREDFNEANRQRFQHVEYWMQNHREVWTQSTFNRDQLCMETGLNRHLLLQCVRSQGYNDTHEYLNTYRCEELKRLIQRGMVRSISEVVDAGFGTTKTARTVFQKVQGISLDDYMSTRAKTDK